MKTKIIATVGSAKMRTQLEDMIKEGVDIVRINMKYVPLEDFKKIEKRVRKFKKVKILIDIKDRRILPSLVEEDFEYLAVSFAEKPSEIKQIRSMFPKRVKIISKIESKKGVANIDELIKVSEGIMIARGDLGRSIPIEKVPFVQKLITKKCNKHKKFSITATEMMPSMVSYVRPSRAEVSDIVNAVLEGSDALLLAEETAIGKHPVLVVKTLKKIIKEAEKHLIF